MVRTGRIAAIDNVKGAAAIATEDDGYTIIDLLSGWGINVGDQFAWASGHQTGPAAYVNLTRDTWDEVSVRQHSVARSDLPPNLRL